jgi:pimeloyl-ACP methyl ester carboxylesterase
VHTDEFVAVDGVEIHYAAWGDEENQPVLCVHGLSRVGRDFDPLARALSEDYRVLCPDLPGRGLSEWAPARYTPEAMVQLLVGFCDRLDLETLRWVGTSMGGRLGLALAAGPLSDRIERVVTNDVGPAEEGEADSEGIQRIIEYLTNPPSYDALSELEGYYRETYAAFGEMRDTEWRRFTLTSARRRDDGAWTPSYDTRIVEPVVTADPDVDPWARWDALDVPTLVLRGEHSAILTDDTLEEMLERRPETESLLVGGCGHAPALNTDRQIEAIRSVLAD